MIETVELHGEKVNKAWLQWQFEYMASIIGAPLSEGREEFVERKIKKFNELIIEEEFAKSMLKRAKCDNAIIT